MWYQRAAMVVVVAVRRPYARFVVVVVVVVQQQQRQRQQKKMMKTLTVCKVVLVGIRSTIPQQKGNKKKEMAKRSEVRSRLKPKVVLLCTLTTSKRRV